MAKLGNFTLGPSKISLDGGKTGTEAAVFSVSVEPMPKGNGKTTAHDLTSLVASINAQSGAHALGHVGQISAAVYGWLYQDDDAHDTCTLTACLNPLHPGPCKGWKHTLHSVAPEAWKKLEEVRVEKANANRIKKIEALKQAGKPIPKKLLIPIVAKPHPNAGKTANAATGEAHEAGKAVSDAAGVKVSEPGKVSLGQAVKMIKATDATTEKGVKGKKPTVMSKGIAHVIAQEKVTPQYKLDKASTITPEQWSALSADEKSIIRGELTKIQNEGFGPQQKKASDLLDKLTETALSKTVAPKLGELNDSPKAPAGPTSAGQAAAIKAITEAIHGPQGATVEQVTANVEKMKPEGKPIEEHPGFPKLINALAQKALAKASADKMPGLGHGANDAGISEFHKQISEHIKEGKPGLPPLVEKMAAHHEAVKAGNVKEGIEKAAKGAPETPKPTKLSEAATPKVAVATSTKAEKPKALPAHVEHAIAMANGTAPGASWSKNHLAAYQPLSAEEFKALPPDIQAKIKNELEKGKTKFLDPKKIAASQALLDKFKGAPKAETKPPESVTFVGNLHDHSVTQAQAKEVVDAASIGSLKNAAQKVAGLTDDDNPDLFAHKMTATNQALGLVKSQVKMYTPAVTGQPDVEAAMAHLKEAAEKLSYAQIAQKAKGDAYNKIHLKLSYDKGELAPIEKAALQRYQKYLVSEHAVKTDSDTMSKLQADTIAATNNLNDKLQAALKKANAPKADDMSDAQITDKAKELLGESAGNVNINLGLAGLKESNAAALKVADGEVAKYPGLDITEPSVAAKYAALVAAAKLAENNKAAHDKMIQHLVAHHSEALTKGMDVHGNQLTAEDKKIISKHAGLISQNHKWLTHSVNTSQEELVKAKDDFNAAAKKAAGKAAGPVELSEFDKANIDSIWSAAWGKQATAAVTYGLKTAWGPKGAEMKAHPDYVPFTQDLGNLKALAGKVAFAHAVETAAEHNVPTHPDTGDKLAGPEKEAWAAAKSNVAALEKQFSDLHKQAQTKLDTIRTSMGLNKRSLPKVDAPAVKTAAAESGYYKSAGYSGPNYGKPAAAKNYMLAKVGPKLGVVHQTSSEKKAAKVDKTLSTLPPMPVPKVHAKPPVSEIGNKPNPDSAAKLGYHYTDKVSGGEHGWTPGDAPAYVSSPEQLKELQDHLAKPDTKFGLGAQKEFKWSIANMESKGAATSGKKALYGYTGSGYGTVNQKLNSLPPGAQKTGSTTISSIDNAFKAAPPLGGDVVLYRGFSNPQGVFKSGKWNDVNVAGMEWSQRSYSSTSGAISTAQSFAGHQGVVMRIIIPKEMQIKGINAKGGQHPGENEIILQRGLRYRVVADYGKAGSGGDQRRYVDVMVVPNPYDKAE